ncbi:helix-turn-helix transcriptional regulator [Actinoplanes regularis]|uniref:helix-turn-helix transcriptional regulator n=1 Tax=Actinoplanes regularis TaxID=52697 RepID=UPI0015C67133|nr:LuxR family transcriptional regulator [Actinoplanes regularis]
MQEVERLLRAATENRGGALLLGGAPGSGRSTLLRTAAAQAEGWTVLTVPGHLAERDLALAALHRLTDQARRSLTAGPGPDEDFHGRNVVTAGDSLLRLLGTASAHRPLLCLLDDAHLFDPPSLRVIAYAARRLGGQRIALLAAGPPDLAECARPVPPLSPEDCRALLAARAPDLADDVAAALTGLSGGNPAALTDLAAALSPEQRRGYAPLPVTLPPDSPLRRRLRAELGALPPATRELLLLAAADPPVPLPDLLAAAAAGAPTPLSGPFAATTAGSSAPPSGPIAATTAGTPAPPSDPFAATTAGTPAPPSGPIAATTAGTPAPPSDPFAATTAGTPAPLSDPLAAAAAGAPTPLSDPLAAATVGAGPGLDDLAPAERAGLITIDGTRVHFGSEVVRAVTYREMPAIARRAAHLALARVSAARGRLLDALLHRAAAATTADPALAAALTEAAAPAAPSEAAKALRYAAELTRDPAERAAALVGAARSAWLAGRPHEAIPLIRDAERSTGWHRSAAIESVTTAGDGTSTATASDATPTTNDATPTNTASNETSTTTASDATPTTTASNEMSTTTASNATPTTTTGNETSTTTASNTTPTTNDATPTTTAGDGTSTTTASNTTPTTNDATPTTTAGDGTSTTTASNTTPTTNDATPTTTAGDGTSTTTASNATPTATASDGTTTASDATPTVTASAGASAGLPAPARTRLRARGLAAEMRPDEPTSREILLDVAAELGDGDPLAALDALSLAGEAASLAGEQVRYAVLARRVMARQHGDETPAVAMAYHHVAGLAEIACGDQPAAFTRFRRELDLAGRVAEPMPLIRAATAGILVGDARRATAAAGRAAVLAAAGGARSLVPRALELAALAGMAAGDYDSATTAALDGVAMARGTGQSALAATHLGLLAVLAALVGDRENGQARIRAATGTDHARPLCEWALALLDLVDGRQRAAAQRLHTLVAGPPGRGSALLRVAVVPHLLEAAGPEPALNPVAAAFDDWAGRTGQDVWLALRDRCRALRTRDGEAAEAHFHTALRRVGEGGFPRAHTELLYGRLLRRRRRHVAAREHLRRAAETFRLLGADPWAAQSVRELRAAGERPATGAGCTVEGGLTAQQERIAALVAEGATNREVAQELHLSPRTVDHHLRNVFARLGVRSRTEMARLLATR